MENYKIKVTTEAESEEVCNLMEQLGLSKKQFTGFGFPCVIAVYGNEYSDLTLRNREIRNSKELTIPQLQDLVVLHRNDVGDATHTHKNFEQAKSIILSATNEVCDWIDDKWKVTCRQVSELKPIQPQPEQGLISGADALRVLADGKEVEYKENSHMPWGDSSLIAAKLFLNTSYQFRLKPKTITLSIKIPAPFEPTEDEEFYVLSSVQSSGYIKTHVKKHAFLGAWKSEHDIQQVVVALRKGFKL